MEKEKRKKGGKTRRRIRFSNILSRKGGEKRGGRGEEETQLFYY